MIIRKLFFGALMLCIGAAFTFMLAAAMQQHATVAVPSYQPAALAAPADKRTDREWMF